MFDVVGVGANSVDYVYSLPGFPDPDTAAAKLRIGRHLISPGGQTTTTLSTCAAMGLRTAYIGTISSDANGTLIREDIRLTTGFAARVDVSLSVASLAETVTVSGAAPATPKKTTDGTPSRLRASALEMMSGSAGSLRAINSLPAHWSKLS